MTIKTFDDFRSRINKLVEGFNEGLDSNSLRLAERYIETKTHFLIHFSIRGIDEEFVACFQRVHRVSGPEENGDRDCLNIRKRCCHHLMHMRSNVKTLETGADRNKQTVFVNNVKSIETPELVIPSFVWFDRIDSFYRLWPHSLYFSRLSDFVFRGRVKDGGIHSLIKILGESLSNNSRDLRRQLPDFGEIVDKLSCLRIGLGADFIGVGIKKGFENDIEVLDVLFGPFDLNPSSIQRMHMLYSKYTEEGAYIVKG